MLFEQVFIGINLKVKNMSEIGMIFDAFLEVPDKSNLNILAMKKILLPVLLLFFAFSFSQEQRIIFGKVTDGANPLENVNIEIESNNIATTSDKDGKYQIAVETGDMVKFSYTGLKTIKIKIEDVTRILNPVMIPDITELDEVVIEASKRRSQKDLAEDYSINKNIIKTAWGYLDAERAAGNIRMLSEDEINPISLCILDLLRNRFAGIRVIGSCATGGSTGNIGSVSSSPLVGGSVLIRGASSLVNLTPAIFDVDGQIFQDAPVWIDVTNIKRVAILGNLATTVAYGNLGRGGVIVINTVNGNPKSTTIVDRARLKNNFVRGRVLTESEMAKSEPSYLKALKASSSFQEAKEIFLANKNKYNNSAYFFIDAYIYFYEDLKEAEFADGIIKENFRLFEGNAVLLKALAYTYEGQERFDKAHKLYKEIFILRPNYSQSFLDVANSYRNINANKFAASMYARYDYLIEESFIQADTIVFDKIMQREYNNLLALHKNEIMDSKKSKKIYVAEEDFKGTRLVFEWNDSEAEFDLQFVNPSSQYYMWKHSLADNADVIYREKDFGYNITEYLLDGSLPGTWQVNINYSGNKSLTPTFLKATVYYNYGTSAQRKEVKTFKLSLKNVNQELFKITVGSKMVSR